MFSSQPTTSETAAAARRRMRPISRPNSRNQHRNDRAGSNTSISRGAGESSIISQRGASGLDKELRPISLTATRGDNGGKDADGGVVDWVSWNILHTPSQESIADRPTYRQKMKNIVSRNCQPYQLS